MPRVAVPHRAARIEQLGNEKERLDYERAFALSRAEHQAEYGPNARYQAAPQSISSASGAPAREPMGVPRPADAPA